MFHTSCFIAPRLAFRRVSAIVLLSGAACADANITVNASGATTAIPFAAVLSAYVQGTHDHLLTAKAGADTYTLTWHSSLGMPATFEGTPAVAMDYTNSITKNGVAVAGASLTDYFTLQPVIPLGGMNHTQGSFEVASEMHPLPATALTGQVGPLGVSTKYASAAKQSILAHGTSTWSVEADGATAAWACINVVIKYTTPGQADGYESVCHRTDATGTWLGVRISVDLNGARLEFK